jgi:predicted ATPase
VDQVDVSPAVGGKSLHEQSHGESFLVLVNERLGADGLYLMDEPESALSPQRQLALLAALNRLVQHNRSQLIVATHSPILLAYPEARIFSLDEQGIAEVEHEQTEHYSLTRDFLLDRERYLRQLKVRDGDQVYPPWAVRGCLNSRVPCAGWHDEVVDDGSPCQGISLDGMM